MAGGTRAAVALREAVSRTAEDERIGELQRRLLELTGKAHRTERNQINRELWNLTQQQQQTEGAPLLCASTQMPASSFTAGQQQQQQLIEHWCILHGTEALQLRMAHCVRCGDGTAASCRFHPDAKAFAFGTGRFDYGYSSAWDTPHDVWFCCGSASPGCPGCCEEPAHSTDSEWWRPYAAAAPALVVATDDEGESDAESDGSAGEVEVRIAAMDIG